MIFVLLSILSNFSKQKAGVCFGEILETHGFQLARFWARLQLKTEFAEIGFCSVFISKFK
jgi:hypothetical protein